jgi:hypothetical protein
MTFDKKIRKQVTDHLNETIFQENVRRLVRQEIEKLQPALLPEELSGDRSSGFRTRLARK